MSSAFRALRSEFNEVNYTYRKGNNFLVTTGGTDHYGIINSLAKCIDEGNDNLNWDIFVEPFFKEELKEDLHLYKKVRYL